VYRLPSVTIVACAGGRFHCGGHECIDHCSVYFVPPTSQTLRLPFKFYSFVDLMDILVSVDNFEDGGGNYREINSPRTLESCLRQGLDPSELYPRPRKNFFEKNMSKEMVDIKYDFFEKKRRGMYVVESRYVEQHLKLSPIAL